MRRVLTLKSPLRNETRWVQGENCDAVEHVDGGYEIHVGSAMLRVEGDKVDHFEQDPRPGYAHEQANRATDLPSFAKQEPDGSFTCTEPRCGKNVKKLHALRVHHGTVHGGER